MADIKLSMKNIGGDIELDGYSLAGDDGLETAVVMSLFTDRRAEDDDNVPGDKADRRGWWADAYTDIEGDQIGSRLWLLAREKTTPDIITKAKDYAKEALDWLISDGIAKEVNIEAGKGRNNILWLAIEIVKPSGTLVNYKYQNLWERIHA